MNIVILDAFEDDNSINKSLKKVVSEKEKEFTYYKLKDMNIKRCKGCGACSDKTPGRCVIKDDMQLIFKDIAKSDWIIMLTPLRFGGYSSLLKLVVDRFMVLGLPLYYVKNGILFHRSRYAHKKYFGIALAEENLQGQEENFNKIVLQNAANLSYTGRTAVFRPADEISKIEKEISTVLAGGKENEQ